MDESQTGRRDDTKYGQNDTNDTRDEWNDVKDTTRESNHKDICKLKQQLNELKKYE